MNIRKATVEDVKTLTHRLARNQKSWATVSHMKNDIMSGYLWLLEDENNIVASCAVTPTSYGWQGVTPWDENKAMIHIAEKCGFQFRYKFMEYWNCYIKNNA